MGAIGAGILRRPRGKAIYIAVVHAKGGGNEYGVMDLDVGGALGPGATHCVGGDILTALLNLRSDGEECFELGGDRKSVV